MTKILLVRHGYSEYNHVKKFTGHLDISLTPLGVKQAEITAQYLLERYKIDGIYSSDLSRAVHTAKPVAEALGLSIVTDKRLRELNLGDWTDMYIADVKEKYPVEYEAYRKGARCLGGESLDELKDRALAAVYEIAQANEGKTVLIVAHGGTIRAILRGLQNLSVEEASKVPIVSNNSVTEIHYQEGAFQVVKISYDEHLTNFKTWQEKELN